MFTKNEKGLALPLVLLIMLTVSLLGVTVWQYSVTDTIHVALDADRMQAHYLARSGADAVANFIITNPNSLPNMNQYVNQLIAAGQSSSVNLGQAGVFRVRLTRVGNNIIINSTAQSGQAESTATLTLSESSNWVAPNLDMALFSNNGLTMSNSARVTGNVGTNSNDSPSIRMTNSALIDGNINFGPTANVSSAVSRSGSSHISGTVSRMPQPRLYVLPPFPIFPEDLINRGSINLTGTQTDIISTEGRYNDISLSNSSHLTINLAGETRIRVNNLHLSNNTSIRLQGSGTLLLYVDGSFSLSNSATINNNGDPSALFLFYKGTGAISPVNSTVFVGSIFAESANFSLSNAGSITGNIFTGGTNVNISNGVTANVRALLAPNATVTLSNSAEIRGALVAREVFMSNSAQVRFDSSITDEVTVPGGDVNYALGFWQEGG